MSSLPEEHLEEKVERMVLTAKTEKTIVDKEYLLLDIEITRSRRFALSVEEFLPGLITIGSPLFDSGNGKGVGAISFNFSTLQNTAERIEIRYADMIREAAIAIAELLPPERIGKG